jgi:hypothetical protein
MTACCRAADLSPILPQLPPAENAKPRLAAWAYGSAVNFEVSPWSGLLRPATGPVPMGNWTDAGLLVPDVSVTAGHLGLIQTGG